MIVFNNGEKIVFETEKQYNDYIQSLPGFNMSSLKEVKINELKNFTKRLISERIGWEVEKNIINGTPVSEGAILYRSKALAKYDEIVSLINECNDYDCLNKISVIFNV